MQDIYYCDYFNGLVFYYVFIVYALWHALLIMCILLLKVGFNIVGIETHVRVIK